MIRLYWGAAAAPRRTATAVLFHSLFSCYGGDSGVVRFWRAGEALLYALGDTLHITGHVPDVPELCAFVKVLGFRRIYCTQKLARRAGWQLQTPVIELVQQRRCTETPYAAELKLQQIYDVLRESGGAISMPPFADFCVDFSHRLRHGGARFVGDARGVAITTGETEAFAFIGGVAVLPAYRGTGLASRLVQGLSAALQREGKTVLTATVPPLLPFYRQNGFVPYRHGCYCRPD